jgi:hypothetical protein
MRLSRGLVVLLIAMLLAPAAPAAPKFYEKATVVQMNTAKCMSMQADNHGVVGALFGPAQASAAQNLSCAQYVLQSERVLYRVQARKGSDAQLLPLGEQVSIRLHKNHLLVRPDDADKEFEFGVISMTLRTATGNLRLIDDDEE